MHTIFPSAWISEKKLTIQLSCLPAVESHVAGLRATQFLFLNGLVFLNESVQLW